MQDSEENIIEPEKNTEENTIETDKDTEEQDRSEDAVNSGEAFFNLEMAEVPYTIFDYLRRVTQQRIIVQPDFQRLLVWTADQRSRFIESVLMNFPIPPMYLNETVDAKYMIIDGLQRTTALGLFYNNAYKLSGLETLKEYNDIYFRDLPETLQTKFEDKKLTIFALSPRTPMKVIYDLFNRINTGGTQLNRQEVRNCIYIGESTKLLRKLSEEDFFRRAISNGIKPTRMKDREAILRYLSFRWLDYENNYKGDISEFIEEAMKGINRMSAVSVQEMYDDFRYVMEWSYRIWGRQNFRVPTATTRGSINVAILESVCKYLSGKSDDFLERNTEVIRRNFVALLNDDVYFQSVSTSTGNRIKVLDRFRIAATILNFGTND